MRIPMDTLIDAAKRRMISTDNPGFCTACGHEQNNCEPDATGYTCESCGKAKVSSPEMLLGII